MITLREFSRKITLSVSGGPTPIFQGTGLCRGLHDKTGNGKKRMCGSADVQPVKCGCKCGSTSAFYPTYSWQLTLTVDDWIFVIVRWIAYL